MGTPFLWVPCPFADTWKLSLTDRPLGVSEGPVSGLGRLGRGRLSFCIFYGWTLFLPQMQTLSLRRETRCGEMASRS